MTDMTALATKIAEELVSGMFLSHDNENEWEDIIMARCELLAPAEICTEDLTEVVSGLVALAMKGQRR